MSVAEISLKELDRGVSLWLSTMVVEAAHFALSVICLLGTIRSQSPAMELFWKSVNEKFLTGLRLCCLR